MVGNERPVDLVPLKQIFRYPSVLAKNEVDLLECADCPKRDVFEISDRCGDNIKGWHVSML